MKIFLDTANLEDIRQAAGLGIIDGVTTNPSLVSREGVRNLDDMKRHFSRMAEWVDGDISVEVIATEYDAMLAEAHELASIDPRMTIKIPATQTGIRVLHRLAEQGYKTNCTLVFSPLQALAAMKAGATYVSPFIGRLEDQGVDGLSVVQTMVQMKREYGYATEILCASVRTKQHIQRCLEMGVDIVTCPYPFILSFFDHPQTREGLKKFLSDYHGGEAMLQST